MITGKNYIGNLLSSVGEITFTTFNPKTNLSNNHTFVEASTVEIQEAVALATKAFDTYKNKSGVEKSVFLLQIASEIEALGDKLLHVYCEESGLPLARAISERTRTLFQLQTFAKLVKEGSWVAATIETAQPDRKPIPKPDLRKMLVPLGPVVVFGASNFPLAYSTAGGDTASALAAGCPVIVKSHPMHAGTGELVASAIIKAAEKTGMPNGVFSNLNSSGIQVGIALVEHPQVKAVGFTGSLSGGRALYDLAAKRDEPIPVFAEMGSINPVVLLPTAARTSSEKWAQVYAQSITLGTGQFCTNPGLILGVKSADLDEFISKLSSEILKVAPSCMLHPAIIGNYEKNKETLSSQQGVKVVTSASGAVKENYARQTVITVLGSTFLKNPTLHQEVFGPFSMVVQCDTVDELREIIVHLEGQLTGTILAEGDDFKKYPAVVEGLKTRVGRIIFNGVPTGVEVCDAMVHGGPYPASTDSRFTAVGTASIKRWVRPFSYQNWPNSWLPDALKNENPLGIARFVNGERTTKSIG